jgi:hypothetical protein
MIRLYSIVLIDQEKQMQMAYWGFHVSVENAVKEAFIRANYYPDNKFTALVNSQISIFRLLFLLLPFDIYTIEKETKI